MHIFIIILIDFIFANKKCFTKMIIFVIKI